MSSGNFIFAFYKSSTTLKTHPIRIQPETAQLNIAGTANTIPAGPADDPRRALVSSRRRVGLNAAKVNVVVTVAGTSGFAVGTQHSIPWLDYETLLSVIEPPFQTGTYLGASVRVTGYSPEKLVP